MKKKILVVEDNEKNMKLFSALLQVHNFEVLEAKDAESGIELLKHQVPDLILMDTQLPGMDGFTATRMIKKNPKLKDVYVIALAAYAMQGDEERALEAGCDGFITKPIDTRSFLEKIENFFQAEQKDYPSTKEKIRAHKKRILIVDDEPQNLRLLEAMLPPGDFDVFTATNGEEGVKKVYDLFPDVILLDLMMPKKDGYTVARELKEDPTVQDIPIILLTALDGTESRIAGLEAGAEEYLSKPVKNVELLSRIRSMLHLKEYREQLLLRRQSEAIYAEASSSEREADRGIKYRPNILLVEDNPVDASVIQKVLEMEPIVLEKVQKGEEAVARIMEGGIDLVLLDILLPDTDGFDICKRLKSTDVMKDIPVIVITCLDDMDSRIKGVKLGADDFLVKPINPQELKARIKVLLEKKSQFDSLKSHYVKALNSAVIDALTGLYNHGYFKNFLNLEIKRSQRQNYAVCLLMVDIDDFKLYNDTCGHSIGDDILQNVGNLIRGEIREVDLIARYGGDEYAVVLPYSDKHGAVKVAARIQRSLSSSEVLKQLKGDLAAVTVSIGIAEYPSDTREFEEMIQKADEMLYEAKKQGKNQVCAIGYDQGMRKDDSSVQSFWEKGRS